MRKARRRALDALEKNGLVESKVEVGHTGVAARFVRPGPCADAFLSQWDTRDRDSVAQQSPATPCTDALSGSEELSAHGPENVSAHVLTYLGERTRGSAGENTAQPDRAGAAELSGDSAKRTPDEVVPVQRWSPSQITPAFMAGLAAAAEGMRTPKTVLGVSS
jgi:hypothetical protein